jgi:hypothetical protein
LWVLFVPYIECVNVVDRVFFGPRTKFFSTGKVTGILYGPTGIEETTSYKSITI